VNTQTMVPTRQFWAGVVATALAGLLVSVGIPNFLRTNISSYELSSRRTSVARAEGERDKLTADRYAFEAKDESDRKTIRNEAIALIVKNPRETSEKIRQLAERSGGFLVSS
jgi:hypothetical protein